MGAQISTEALLQDLHWRNIGPANQGGRIVDIEALDNDFTQVWRATLWENVSRGGQRGNFLFMGENPRTVENASSNPRGRTRHLATISYLRGDDNTSAYYDPFI